MRKEYTIKEKWEMYEKLSQKNKDLFWDDGVSARIKKSSSRYNLTEDQNDILFDVIAMLFLGVLLPSQLPKTIKEEILLENNTALAQEIIRFVIYPVHHILRNLYADEEFDKIGVKKDFSAYLKFLSAGAGIVDAQSLIAALKTLPYFSLICSSAAFPFFIASPTCLGSISKEPS